jgi:hypothetical protein
MPRGLTNIRKNIRNTSMTAGLQLVMIIVITVKVMI